MSPAGNASRGRLNLGVAAVLMLSLIAALAYLPGRLAAQPLSVAQQPVGGAETIYGTSSRVKGMYGIQSFLESRKVSAEQRVSAPPGLAGMIAQAKQAGQVAAKSAVGPKAAVRPLANSSIPSLFTAFDGPNMNDAGFFRPPDDVLAVGSGFVVVCVNKVIGIYDKANPASPVGGFVPLDTSIGGFFEGQPDFGPGSRVSDPRCVYDEVHDRFIVTMLQFAFSTSGTPPFPGSANLLVAASQTSDPTGQWFKYAVPLFGVKPDDPTKRTFGDQPTLGISRDFLYVSADDFPLDPADNSGFQQDQMKILRLSELESGAALLNVTTFGGANLTDAGGFFSFAMKPVVTHYQNPQDPTSNPGLPEFVVSPDPRPNLFGTVGTYFSIMAITQGPVPALTKRLLAVPTFRNPNSASQPGTTVGIDTNDSSRTMSNAVWRNNSIWCAHTVRGNNGEAAVNRWYEITAANINNVSLRQTGIVAGLGNAYFPSVEVNRAGNVVMGFSTSSDVNFASAAFVTRGPLDPLNTMRATCVYKPGEGPYEIGRWGDYSGAAVDPTDDSLWVVNEFAGPVDPNLGINLWATSAAHVTLQSFGISGTVFDEFGTGLPGVTVRLEGFQTAQTSRSSTARFTIPDFPNTTGAVSSLSISDVGTVEQATVTVDVAHPITSELRYFLVAPPDVTRPGSDNTFPLAGILPNLTVLPNARTGELINGRKINGQWSLIVKDVVRGTVGTLQAWTLNFNYNSSFGVTPQTTGPVGTFSFNNLVPGARYVITPVAAGRTFTPQSVEVILDADRQGVDFQANAAPPVDLQSLVITPASVAGGGTATATVTLTDFAPGPGGVEVTIETNDSSLTLPATVTVPAGQRSVTFQIGTQAVDAESEATITATMVLGGGTPQQATLRVTPVGAITLLRINPTSVVGGDFGTGTLTLGSVAPSGGVTVQLRSNSAAIGVPATVVVPGGQSSVTFTVNTRAVATPVAGSITATLGGLQQTATFTVLPPSLVSLLVSPDPVRGGSFSRARLRLRTPAPGSGAQVTLSSANPQVAWFKQRGTGSFVVTIPPGQSEMTVIVGTSPVARATVVQIRATQGSRTVVDALTVTR